MGYQRKRLVIRIITTIIVQGYYVPIVYISIFIGMLVHLL